MHKFVGVFGQVWKKWEALACLSDRVPRLMWITTSPGDQRDVVDGVVMVVLKSDMKSLFE